MAENLERNAVQRQTAFSIRVYGESNGGDSRLAVVFFSGNVVFSVNLSGLWGVKGKLPGTKEAFEAGVG